MVWAAVGDLLAQDDPTLGAHVVPSLGGALVGACLEADVGLASGQHLLREFPFVLLGGAWAQPGACPLVVHVRLVRRPPHHGRQGRQGKQG